MATKKPPSSDGAGDSKPTKLSDKVQRMQLSTNKVVPVTDEQDETTKRRRKRKPPPPAGARAPVKVSLADEVSALAHTIIANASPVVECCGHFAHFGVPGATIVSKALQSLPDGNSVITELILDGNALGDEGAKVLAENIGKLHNLKALELRDNEMHDEGVQTLCRALMHSKCLERLSLSGNDIGTRACKAVATLALEVPTLSHVLLLECKHLTLPSLGCFTRAVLTMPDDRPLTFFEGLEWSKLCEPMKLKKQFEFDAEVLAYLKELRDSQHVRERERLLRLEQTLQEKWHVHEVDKAEEILRDALHIGAEQEVRDAVNRARGMDCPDHAPWMVKAVSFIKECVAARKRERMERKRRRRWRRREKARRERERAEREAQELEEAMERDKKPRGLLMFTLLCGFCCLLTACGMRPAFLNAKDRMTYVIARLNVTCFAITFAFGIFVLYLVATGDDEFVRAAAATITDAATSATATVASTAGANISTEIEANIDGRTFEACQAEDVMPALHYYTSLAACEAGGTSITQFLPFETPQTCEDGLLSTILSVGDTPCNDDDSDGVCNAQDACPDDALNDADSDNICDALDSCPNDSRNDLTGPDGSPDGVCDRICQSIGGDLSLSRDGVCNAENNINACGWDGGDCVASSCPGNADGTPFAGDSACDQGAISSNTRACSWDGGDCCSPLVNETSCLDPFGDRPCVSSWSEWSSCDICGRNILKYRTFTVAVESTGLGRCIHADGFVDTDPCVGTYFPCDTDSDGIVDTDDTCTCDNSTGFCPSDDANPDVDSDYVCDIGFDPCVDGVWLIEQTNAITYTAVEPNDNDIDGICDVVDSCLNDAENDADSDFVCDGAGLENVVRVPTCMPVTQCPGPLKPYCDEFQNTATSAGAAGALYMRLSCDEVCLRNSVVQRDCNSTTEFSAEVPLLPVESSYVGIPAVVNRCVETVPDSGIWIMTGCTDYVPEIGLYADGNCSIPLGNNVTAAGAIDFRNFSAVDGLRLRVPDPVAAICDTSTDGAVAVASFEHRCYVRTSLDDTVTIVLIASVSVIAALVLALVIKNIVDRKKYQKEVIEEEVISDSSEEEEDDGEVDEFDVDEFGRTKEEAAAADGDADGTDSDGGAAAATTTATLDDNGGESKNHVGGEQQIDVDPTATHSKPSEMHKNKQAAFGLSAAVTIDADPAAMKHPHHHNAENTKRPLPGPRTAFAASGGGGGGGGGGAPGDTVVHIDDAEPGVYPVVGDEEVSAL